MNTDKLNYQDFREELRRILYDRMPKDVRLDIYPVLKNNSLHLDGLVLRREGCGAAPNFYLQEYYQQYLEGNTICGLAEEIMARWSQMESCVSMCARDMNFEDCKCDIFYRLVSAGRNQEMLEEIPYIPFQDLAVVFFILVSRDEEGIGCIRISNGMIERWGVNLHTLAAWAGKNTPRLFPARCSPISRVMEQIAPQTGRGREEYQGCPPEEPYVLTNSIGINGAAVWLYPGLLRELADDFGSNLYILPSSIHELLLVTDEGKFQPGDMLRTVAQVNRECVLQEEILSDNIYYYDRQKRMVIMIENNEE